MKTIKFGNILDVKQGLIVHGVNCRGRMGSGVALAIREQYPQAYTSYREHLSICESFHKTPLGTVDYVELATGLWLANAFTQEGYGQDGKRYVNYEAVQECFKHLAVFAAGNNLAVHYPLIGAGLGGGDWTVINEIIDLAFTPHPMVERILWLQP